MNHSKMTSQAMPLLYKTLHIVLVVCCLFIGLMGLILPIIPGFLFLFFAAILLARVSSRFKYLLHNHGTIKAWMKHWHSTTALSIPQRAKLVFWVVARSTVKGIESVVSILKTSRNKS